ncbi:hypothetical protein [Sphingomonas swuensis]|uniref:hypothetical protein n=1 Tax=Sphingomonas swuensis TaxID=977800 RepID=UPI0031CEC691
MLRTICRAFGHRRDKRSVRPLMDGWRGEYRRCGAPMIRTASAKWRLAAPRTASLDR